MDALDEQIRILEAAIKKLEGDLAVERKVLAKLKKARASMDRGDRNGRRASVSIPTRLVQLLRDHGGRMQLQEIKDALRPEGIQGPSIASALSRSERFRASLSGPRGTYELVEGEEAQDSGPP